MKHLILLPAILFLISCNNPETNAPESNVQFPERAQFKHPDHPLEDTLISNVGNRAFLITPPGKIYWGQNPADTIHLLTEVTVEKAFLLVRKDTLFVFYTETDQEGATSRVEKINLNKRQRIWSAEIPAFNLGIPYILDNFAYLTAIGTAGKLNLETGKYLYQFTDLYDEIKYSFNGFDTIVFKDSLTLFLSENRYGKRVDTLIVNEKTKERTIKNK